MKKHIYTRSANDQLYSMMRSCFSTVNEFHQCKQFPGADGALNYLYYIISESKEDWIVNCDEDCFITNEEAINELIDFMKANDYDYCGIPDGGGTCIHRNNSWTNVNPFFTIFNARRIRKLLSENYKSVVDVMANWDAYYEKYNVTNFDIDNLILVDKTRYDKFKLKDHLVLCELHENKSEHNNTELFSGFLYWLAYNFRGIYLNAKDHVDGISTILLDLNGKPFAKHSWYSREFRGAHHDRILNLFEEVKNQKNENINSRSIQR